MSGYLTLPRLWAAAVLVCVFAAVAFTWVYPADFWWHVRYGEIFLQTGSFPTTDSLSFTMSGAPYHFGYRLSDVTWAAALATGGLAGVVFLNALLFTAAFGLVMRACWTVNGHSVRAAAAATALGFAASVENWSPRPQSFSVLLFAATLLILVRYVTGHAPPRWLTALPAVTVVWANTHGAFLLAPVLQATVLAGLLLGRRFGGAQDSRRPVAPLVAATLTSGLACVLLDVDGPAGFMETLRLPFNPSVRQFALEWGPTTLDAGPGRALLAVTLVTVIAIAATRRRPPLWLLLPALTLLVLGWASLRGVVWAGMGLAPLLAWALGRHTWLSPAATPRAPLPSLATAGLLALIVVASLPWLRQSLPLPPERRVLAAPDTPFDAGAALADAPTDRVFSDMQWASFLMWRLPDGGRVFVDPRFELYPPELWEQYGTISLGVRPDLLDLHRIDGLLLHYERQAGLLEWVERQPNWQPLYRDAYSSAWVRVT